MPTIFGPEWESLELADVESFLAGADPEPLVWEAKGTDVNRHHVRRTVCGFGNSHDISYLILGATYADDRWSLDGYAFPDEPPVWIDSVVRDEVRPTPYFDVRSWRVDESDQHVAVVRVEPVATPPCITRGTVYERVPGRTIAVRDPQRLADLYSRGDRARSAAEGAALELRKDMLGLGRDRHPMYAEDRVQAVLTAATTGYQPDISARLFTRAFRNKLWDVASSSLPSDMPNQYIERHPEMEQDAHRLMTAAPSMTGYPAGWIVQGSWSGAVGLYWVTKTDEYTNQALAHHIFSSAWQVATELLEVLGGYGQAYVALSACGAGHERNAEDVVTLMDFAYGTLLERGPIDVTVDALDLDSIQRELERALGQDAFEPGDE
jgi:hypothetical protein